MLAITRRKYTVRGSQSAVRGRHPQRCQPNERKPMIHLNLPIRRLVSGAILLATWGAVTPTPSGASGNEGSKAGCFDAAGNRIVRTTFPDGSEGVVNGINFANMGCFVPIV